MSDSYIKKEDYEEPCCPFDTSGWKKEAPVRPIDIRRVIEKLDEHFYNGDMEGAMRHLLYWKEEAAAGNDLQGEFQVENELMGLCRKLNKGEEAKAHAERALKLIDELNIGDNVGAATSYLNCGTVFRAFAEPEKSVPLFEKAEAIYKAQLKEGDERFGGLYNNMALSESDLGKYGEALKHNRMALSVMEKIPGGKANMAITYLNMANLVETWKGLEDALKDIEEYVEAAWTALNDPSLKHDGYYAFVCEKCYQTFLYYGYLEYGEEIRKRSENKEA